MFQDPYSSLNPRMRVGDIIAEPLIVHGMSASDAEVRAGELLDLVQLRPEHASRFPHQFSGGQRQRVSLARSLALDPDVLVLDEPVSALDVSVQAGIIELLDQLRRRLDLAVVFIAHDLSVVRHVSDVVAVMYLGQIVEIGPNEEVFDRPSHPYTQALLSAVPIPDRSWSGGGRGSSSPATCPAPSILPAAAGSAPAAGRRRSGVPRSSPS